MNHSLPKALVVGTATLVTLLAVTPPVSAQLNPSDWKDYNCYLNTTSKAGAAWDSRAVLIGTLYYGNDNDVHGDSGVCEWLADGGVKAVQSRWVINTTFSVPVSRYAEQNLNAAKGSLQFVAMSDASSTVVTSRSDAGYIAVDYSKGAVGVEIGGSRTENFKKRMLPGQDLKMRVKLNSLELGRCEETERSESRIQVTCIWILDVGTLTWMEPRGRTEGGLQRMSLSGTVSFPGARSVKVQGIFQDNP